MFGTWSAGLAAVIGDAGREFGIGTASCIDLAAAPAEADGADLAVRIAGALQVGERGLEMVDASSGFSLPIMSRALSASAGVPPMRLR